MSEEKNFGIIDEPDGEPVWWVRKTDLAAVAARLEQLQKGCQVLLDAHFKDGCPDMGGKNRMTPKDWMHFKQAVGTSHNEEKP